MKARSGLQPKVKGMPSAYVLINCNVGHERETIEEISHLQSVKEVQGTFGAYDIVAKLDSPKSEKLRETITWNIRKLPHVRSTLTLMETEG